MKITGLYVYPIKALRGIPLQKAQLGPQGVQYDRRIMLCRVLESGELKKMQLSSYPQCALFEQEMAGDNVVVRYHVPLQPLVPAHPLHSVPLEVPLDPDIAKLEKIHVSLHSSPTDCYRMGDLYDAWFSACFGFETAVVFVGDGKRKVLGTFAPTSKQESQGWLSSLTSYVRNPQQQQEAWITFTDCAPFLITTEASLRNVRRRAPELDNLPMYKFRPNIVVDGEDEWAEDLWGELTLDNKAQFLLTANCGRCTSLNVDYDTGRLAEGDLGTVLKKLMKDRRVDKGNKWSPIFGRYGFLADNKEFEVSVGESLEVTKRLAERHVWDWPGLA